jgi:O-antigen ligase
MGDLEIIGILTPLLAAVMVLVIARADPNARSMTMVFLTGVATLGFNGYDLPRYVWVPLEFVVIGLFLLRLRQVRVWQNPAVLACLGFLVLAYISLAWALWRNGMTPGWTGAIVNVTAVTLAAAYLLSDLSLAPRHMAALKYMGLVLGLVALSGIYEAVRDPGGRVSGIYAFVNPFAYMMAIGFMLAVHFWRGPIRVVLALLTLTALFFTASRAGYLMVAVFGLWKIWETARRGQVIPLTALVIGGTIFAAVASQGIEGRYAGIANKANVDAERQLIFRSAELALRQHPVTGLGWGQFKHQYRRYGAYRLSTDSFEVDQRLGFFGHRRELVTHNDFLSVAVEMGLPVFVLFMVGFLFALRNALVLNHPARALVVPLFVGNAVYSLTHNSSNSVIFFYLLFMPFAFSQLAFAPRRARVGQRTAPAGLEAEEEEPADPEPDPDGQPDVYGPRLPEGVVPAPAAG